MSNRFSIYRRLLSYLAPYRAQVAVAYIGMLFASLLNLFVPQIIKTAIDQGIAAHSATALIWAGGLILGLAILRGIAAFVQRFMGNGSPIVLPTTSATTFTTQSNTRALPFTIAPTLAI